MLGKRKPPCRSKQWGPGESTVTGIKRGLRPVTVAEGGKRPGVAMEKAKARKKGGGGHKKRNGNWGKDLGGGGGGGG